MLLFGFAAWHSIKPLGRTDLDSEEDGEQCGAEECADDEADRDEGIHVAAQRLPQVRISCVGASKC